MYERSAIVLERFFENLLGLNKVNNLKRNFNNYCELFQKFKILQQSNSEEIAALKDFQDAENKIEEIQNHEEKLYKKNAKLEYNRDLVFQDISQKPDEIEKCSIKIEGDIQKVQEKLISLREEFVEAVRNYNQKKSHLSKCKKDRKNAENDYHLIFDETVQNFENIPQEYVEIAKAFGQADIQEEIINTLSENGKDEKIPFNNQVITNAAKVGFDISSREVECYIEAYKLAQKLIKELLDGAVSVELHEKNIRNISVKLSFLSAEKEYIVGFLDYERITVIYGKRMHRTLMIDACEKLEEDIEQTENLYKLLLKEIANKPTKKAYQELYNKSYLMDMEDKDAKFKKEKNRINLSTGTIMNSNYWRIEGIKNIYTVFYKNVVEVFGKDLDEFEIPVEQEEILEDSILENQEFKEEPIEELENVKEAIIEEKIETKKQKNIKKAKVDEVEEKVQTIVEEIPTVKVQKVTTEAIKEQSKEIVEKAKKETVKEVVVENIQNKSKLSDLESRIDSVFDEIDHLEEFEEESVHTKNTEKTTKAEDISDTRKTLKLPKIVKRRGRKKVRHYTRQIVQVEDSSENDEEINEPVQIMEASVESTEVIEPVQEFEEEFDIFGEKYRDIDKRLAEIDDVEDYKISVENIAEENLYEEQNALLEEESIFDVMKEENLDINLDEIELNNKNKKSKAKSNIFSSLIKLNSKSKKKLANE